MDELKRLIREVPDFPKPGINFYDITTLLKHPAAMMRNVRRCGGKIAANAQRSALRERRSRKQDRYK